MLHFENDPIFDISSDNLWAVIWLGRDGNIYITTEYCTYHVVAFWSANTPLEDIQHVRGVGYCRWDGMITFAHTEVYDNRQNGRRIV